jgi:tRNA dimethylallyltransferase
VTGVFFIVGPTASGKSDIAAAAARACGAEIVSADAFQVYAGLDLLTAKPDRSLLSMLPHHLIGTVPLDEEMNAGRFRAAAIGEIDAIRTKGKPVFLVGGTGMYVKALTDGLSPLPKVDRDLREQLSRQPAAELLARLAEVDPETARTIDPKNERRLIRALEISLLAGRPASELRARAPSTQQHAGVFIFRDRNELYERIDRRVEIMFASGVVEEVRSAARTSTTSEKTLGLQQIRELLSGQISEAECMAQIQQATRRYAKRQLTWFRRQSTFEPLNLSRYGHSEAIELITRKARLSFAQNDD